LQVTPSAGLVRNVAVAHSHSPTAVALADDWDRLPPIVRQLHEPCAAIGSFHIERAGGLIATVLSWLSGLPRPGTDVPTRLEVRPGLATFTWVRHFGEDVLVTYQRALGPGAIAERLGMIECVFLPTAHSKGLEYQQTGASVCVASLRIPLPCSLAPRVKAWTRAIGDRMEVDVVVSAPVVGTLLHYRGAVHPETIE
jgi:uncharacterized protein DUF4166